MTIEAVVPRHQLLENALLQSQQKPKTRFSIRKDEAGRLMPRHYNGVDPDLVGEKAFNHPSVRGWWSWLKERYQPENNIALITPCSSVKPYTRSPTSRKIRGLLRRLGLWDTIADKPRGIEWLYFSDLLILVPYERAEEYPACCYEVPPDIVLENTELSRVVTTLLAESMEALLGRGVNQVIVFLPRKHLRLWEEARSKAAKWPREHRVTYTLFSTKSLGDAIINVIETD
ncbi:DUF5591 domain-containing protein [Pyrodictium delaneyi]|uniref:DUF5591 domain-containing protein n=1 Tax=Pyrodictium delaneyi TaxID=1273541 RepID=UPI001E3A0744|nr:DUF5591 domain-containing protein [Pyrodictium delaneyi]